MKLIYVKHVKQCLTCSKPSDMLVVFIINLAPMGHLAFPVDQQLPRSIFILLLFLPLISCDSAGDNGPVHAETSGPGVGIYVSVVTIPHT